MKYLFYLIICWSPVTAIAQSYSDSTNEISNVVELPTISKDEIYSRSKIALAKIFKSSKDVIQLDDKEGGKIIAKGVIPYTARAFKPGTDFTGSFPFMLTIEFKDNKYRYSISDIRHSAYRPGRSGGALNNEKPDCGRGILTLKGWHVIQQTAKTEAVDFAKRFEGEMVKESNKTDSW